MTTTHKHAAWLFAIAEGRQIQSYITDTQGEKVWYNVNSDQLLRALGHADFPTSGFRIKPQTITIGDVEVPAPLTRAPAPGVVFWFLSPASKGGVESREWDAGQPWHLTLLDNGACWADSESAFLAFNAITDLLQSPT